MRRIWVVWCWVAIAACSRGPAGRVDLGVLRAQSEVRAYGIMAQPEIDAALDQLISAVTVDADVQQRGEAMLTALASDPAVASGLGQVMARLQSSPEVIASTRELMRAHPGATASEIGEMVGQRAEANWKSPAIQAAWMYAWRRLWTKLEFATLPAALTAPISARFNAYAASHEKRWSDRLIELNGGTSPTPERASTLYLEHAWSEPRTRRCALALFGAPGLRRELVAMVRRLLDVPGVTDAMREASVALVSDPAEQEAMFALFGQLMQPTPSADSVQRELDRMLQRPVMARSIERLVARVFAQPGVPDIVRDAFEHLAGDPQLIEPVDQLLDRW